MSPRKPRPAPFVGYQPAARDRPPVTMYLPIRKTELAALLTSDSATLRKFGERVVAEVAKREQEEIDKLHEIQRSASVAVRYAKQARQEALRIYLEKERAAMTPEQREEKERQQALNMAHAYAVMLGGSQP